MQRHSLTENVTTAKHPIMCGLCIGDRTSTCTLMGMRLEMAMGTWIHRTDDVGDKLTCKALLTDREQLVPCSDVRPAKDPLS